MPFGIIDAPYDERLPGTELLVDDEREDIIPEAEARQLRRIVYKVSLFVKEARKPCYHYQ